MFFDKDELVRNKCQLDYVFPPNKIATVGFQKSFYYDDQELKHSMVFHEEGIGANHGYFEYEDGDWYYTDIPDKNGKGCYMYIEFRFVAKQKDILG